MSFLTRDYVSRFLPYELILLAVLVFLSASHFQELYVDNQNTYFPHGLEMSGETFLDDDWFTSTRVPYLVFSLMVAALNGLGILEVGVYVLEVLLAFSLLGGVALQIAALYDETYRLPRFEFIVIIFALFISIWAMRGDILELLSSVFVGYLYYLEKIIKPVIREFFYGLASQNIYSAYFQPSEFGVLILGSVALAQFNRWYSSFALLGIVALVHFSMLPHLTILAGIFLAWLYGHGERGLAIRSALLFGGLILPNLIYVLPFALGESQGAEAARILVRERGPHHAVPEVWFDTDAAVRLVVMFAATGVVFLKNKSVLRWVMLVGCSYITLGILAVVVTDNNQLALLFPWRGSVYLYPLSLIILLTYGIGYLLARLSLGNWSTGLMLGSSVVVVIALGLTGISVLPQDPVGERDGLVELLRQNTTTDDIILVPASWGSFRLAAERPVYVDWKSQPFIASEVLEWRERLAVTNAFYELPQVTEQDALAICSETGVSYFFFPLAASQALTPVVSLDQYGLYRCSDFQE